MRPLSSYVQIDNGKLIQDHFSEVAREDHLMGPLARIVDGLAQADLTRNKRQQILFSAGYLHDLTYRKAELDLLLYFVGSAMERKSFDHDHQVAFELLKTIFEVEEGEFFQHRPVELATLLGAQLDMILEDSVIDPSEDLYQVALQKAFDLGYDQYLAFCRRALEHAWLRLWDALREQRDPYRLQSLKERIDNLEPLYRLAQLQRRTLGALY